MNIADELRHSFNRFSSNPALSTGDCTFTYRELEKQSLKLAAAIAEQGVHNRGIAIELENPADHIIAILGVVLSGNWYLSLTPENKSFFAEGSFPVSMIISDIGGKPCIQELQPESPAGSFVETALCAFFTSGSTGIPRLVIHSHENIHVDTSRQIIENQISPADKIDLVFSFSFSATLACIFPALLAGAELCVFDLKTKGFTQLAEFWEHKAITFTTLSVTAFHGVCQTNNSLRHLTGLRFISISAEPLKDLTIALFKEKFPLTSVLQIAYATTETRTITQLKISNSDALVPYPDSLGQVVDGKTVKITDEDGHELGLGQTGEIVVVSRHIAFSAMTPNESAGKVKQFPTGDLGYVNEEGYLFYCGRKEREIKLNGIKINAAMVEALIEKAAGVDQTVVVVNAKQGKLVCYYTATLPVDAKILRRDLQDQLPATHIPQFFIRINSYPYTHTGKIDRKQLEQREIPREHHTDSSKSAGFYEKLAASAFCKVLGINHAGPDDDFFDLGGESFTVLLCISEIESLTNTKISQADFVSHSTPYKIGEFLSGRESDGIPRLVSVEHLNESAPNRKNLYFIRNSLAKRSYDQLLDGPLKHAFNLIVIGYDLYKSYTIPGGNRLIMQQMVDVISKDKNAVVIGYSFNGFIAHQLACRVQGISYCILVDTFNYFDYERYAIEKDRLKLLKVLMEKLFVNREYVVLKILMKTLYRKLIGLVRITLNTSVEADFIKAINFMLEECNSKEGARNCIYFQASDTLRVGGEGKSWEPYISGDFHLFTLKGEHSDIFIKHADEMAAIIRRLIA